MTSRGESEELTEKPRVVFDTTAVVQAALAPKGPAETQGLSMIDEGAIEAFMSNRLRSEYERTLHHPDLRARFPHVTEEYIATRLQRLDEKAIRLINPPQYVHFECDPNDEPILSENPRHRRRAECVSRSDRQGLGAPVSFIFSLIFRSIMSDEEPSAFVNDPVTAKP